MSWDKMPGVDEDTVGGDDVAADRTTVYVNAAQGAVLSRELIVRELDGQYVVEEWHDLHYPRGGGEAQYVMLDPPGKALPFDSLDDAVAEAERFSAEDMSRDLNR